MEIALTGTDLILTLLVGVGALQLAWFSVMLLRRGIRPVVIQGTVPPLIAIWVLMWPVYSSPLWVWLGIGLLSLPVVLAAWLSTPFWGELRRAWSLAAAPVAGPMQLLPQVYLLAGLGMAALWFQQIPEFGFGLALCLCLAFPAAELADRAALGVLRFPAHPGQTLLGHGVLILFCAFILAWSLQVYHGIDWRPLLIATAIAGIVASFARALVPRGINRIVALLLMGGTLWLL